MYGRINPSLKRFNYVISETGALYRVAAQKMGLTHSAMQILYSVCCEGGKCYLSEIARATGLSKQTINSAIRNLERDDVVYLEKGEGRNLYVRLTEKGQSLAQERIIPLINAESEILSGWDDDEIQDLIRLNEKFRAELSEKINHFHI